jgi:hypothetical protein
MSNQGKGNYCNNVLKYSNSDENTTLPGVGALPQPAKRIH